MVGGRGRQLQVPRKSPEDLQKMAEAGAIAAAILRFAELGESGREAIGRELSGKIRQHCAVEVGAGRYASLYGEMLRT